jgi:hypothetical protein
VSARPVQPDRVLATVMFTDIVGSTALRDREGRSEVGGALGATPAIVRGELARSAGARSTPSATGSSRRSTTGSSHPLRASDLELRTRAGHPGCRVSTQANASCSTARSGHRRPHRRSRGVVSRVRARYWSPYVKDLVAGSGPFLPTEAGTRSKGWRVAALRSGG